MQDGQDWRPATIFVVTDHLHHLLVKNYMRRDQEGRRYDGGVEIQDVAAGGGLVAAGWWVGGLVIVVVVVKWRGRCTCLQIIGMRARIM